MSHLTLSGSCLCGAVKYEVTGDPERFYHCHCSRCRKATGTGHASNLFLQKASLRWISGEDRIRYFKVPEAKRFANQFCATCGSRLPRVTPIPETVAIPCGSLDSDIPMKPQARIYFGSRTSWSCQDELPVFAESAHS